MIHGRRDPWLLAVLGLSAVLCLYQLQWGLPNGNASWGADALGPLTVLGIARHSFSSWNSGWFYFKYPTGYPLLLLAAYLPYLGFLFVTGGWKHPVATYPYGLADPEAALLTMTLIGRVLSVVMVVTTVALVYGVGQRLAGRLTGLLAAFFVATAYPIVYYGHTTNLDAAYLFWLTLALWATVVAIDTPGRWPLVVVGIGAAMATATKEQGYAFLLSLPIILAYYAHQTQPATLSPVRRWWAAVWNPATRAGLAAAAVTLLVASNAIINPRGLLNRFLNLSGQQIEGVSARFTPVHFSLFKGLPKEQQYVQQFVDVMESSLGLPLLLVAGAGVIYLAWSRSRAAFCILLPAAAYYFVSLRTHDLIQLRYTLPMTMLAGLCAGAMCAAAFTARPRVVGPLIAVLCVVALVRALELDLLLRDDSRYAAETWMRSNMTVGSTVEIYQKPVYLPRFDGVALRSVPLADRSVAGLVERRPDFIVISSAAKKGITHRWNPDWRKGNTLLVESPDAASMLAALEGGQLPYRRVAAFEQHPVMLRVRITSLCPKISIFRRTDASPVAPAEH
jgi:dolichyl-phosphate-mannose-protein mannosyltransferase